MNNNMTCPKCGSNKRVKSGFMNGKQRYLCKYCGCNYTGGRNGYPDSVKHEAIRHYLEGVGFRGIERLLGVSHMSVINWVRQEAKKLEKVEKKEEKVEVIELDELCVNFKKTSGSGPQ